MTKIEERWMDLVVKQGSRCRHCGAKAVLCFPAYRKDNGERITYSEAGKSHVDIDVYKLCIDCALSIKYAKDISTYQWSYEDLKKRDNELDAEWHRRVYGVG